MANLVDVRREGNFIHYRLADDEIYRSWHAMRELGMVRMAEMEKLVRDFREKRNVFEPVSMDELLHRLKSKNIVLLDVRPENEYNRGHIPYAVNIPPEKLTTNLKKLTKKKEYLAYCRGPFCVFADDAVNFLVKNGFRARRITEGFPDWKMRGLPIEQS